MIPLFVGFDQREAVAYHTFVQSVIDTTSVPVAITPLILSALPGYAETHVDGSNTFIYSRFLTPYLAQFSGWAIFADGDMVCREDLKKLWELKDDKYAVMVVKHDYTTKASQKYLGNKNENYPKKNWSSVILWNCSHPKNRVLTPEFVMSKDGKFLHRFSWLNDCDIGEIPHEWNWLTTEYADNYDAKLLHYTLGTPCFKNYRDCDMSDVWRKSYLRTQYGMDS
jgi:lipopolysaccharide biosynthesis glycosyltransferase